MSKVVFLLITLTGYLFLYPQIYEEAKAQQAIVTINPSKLSSQDSTGVDVKIENLRGSQKYHIAAKKQGGVQRPLIEFKLPEQDGTINFHLCAKGSNELDLYILASDCKGKTFKEGTYTISVYESRSYDPYGHPPVASQSFEVYAETVGKIEFLNTSYTTSDEIIIKVNGINDGSYKILVDGKDATKGKPCVDASKGGFELNLGTYYAGSHTIQIYTNKTDNFNPLCGKGKFVTQRDFSISNDPTKPGVPGSVVEPGSSVKPTPKQCKSKDDKSFNKDTDMVCSSGGGIPCEPSNTNNPGIVTAIGCIHTNPVALVKDVLKFALGISGGLAFLLMIFGAFQMLTSAGNPETLNAGKDRLTSAVIGLLLIIFSVLLLQIIGVDILGIPGFGR